MPARSRLLLFLLVLSASAVACDDGSAGTDAGTPADTGPSQEDAGSPANDAGTSVDAGTPGPAYVVASVVLSEEGRTTYFQTLEDLDVTGTIDNTEAVEIPGNAVLLVQGRDVFVGLAEEPTWIRYTVAADGTIEETGRMSFAGLGMTRIDFGNALVDEDTAISASSETFSAVLWNPTTMEIIEEIDLSHLVEEGYALEVWTTVGVDGRVYIPARWSDWEGARILAKVSTTIVDPETAEVVGVAEDDRCASGGRVVIGDDGYAYVMGDGRNYSIHMFANAAGAEPPPSNCLLRIAPGATDFEEGWHHEIPALTGGYESITELETPRQGSGWGFTKLFYPEELPAGVEPVDFAFWNEPAHRMWRIDLGETPTAEPVEGIPFSTVGFAGSSVDGHLYTGESPDQSTSIVYEIDPETNTATERFRIQGLFYALHRLE